MPNASKGQGGPRSNAVIAAEHKAADAACGRKWQCACWPCRAERAAGLRAELDAERAAHARALEMVERALAFVESMPDADNVCLAVDLRAALSAARSEVRP